MPLLLTKAFILKPMKYGKVPLLMEFTGIIMFPEAAGLRGWWNDFWRLSKNAHWGDNT